MSITRPNHFQYSFPDGTNIGDIWWGGGIWTKPLDFPSSWPVSYWNFINVNGASLPADSGMWAELPDLVDLSSYCLSASNEYVNEYNYGTVYHLMNWGSGTLGDEFWEFLLNYCNEYYSWLWGDVYSGLAIMRAGNNSYKFLATYGLYEDAEGHQRIAATDSTTFTLEEASEGAFSWYTNVTGHNEGTTSWNAVYFVTKNTGWGGGREISTNTYEMTDYTHGWIMYFSLYNQSLADTMVEGFTNNAFGGEFPIKTIELNSVRSPYSSGVLAYRPETIISDQGWTLVSGGAFPGVTDTSRDSSKTPADEGGGDGNYDNSSDTIDFPDSDQFAIDALNTGLISVFNPSKNDVIDFANFLYAGSITEAISLQLKRLVADPLDYIIGLNMAHFKPEISGSNTINFGGVSTGVISPIVDPQVQFLDCGAVDVPVQTDSFQDYSMSKIKIYLPYCGTYDLSVTECMDSRIWVQYVIDCLSGACVANVRITRNRDYVKDDPRLDAILYSFYGNCFTSVPLTSRDFKSTITGLMGVASGAGTILGGAVGGNPAIMANGLGTVVNSALNSTPSASRIGNYSSNYGYMQEQKPYLILERPMASVTDGYEGYYGRPIYKNIPLSNCWGYTEVDTNTMWPEIPGITQEEEDMLKSLLNSNGIFIDHDNDYTNYNPRS